MGTCHPDKCHPDKCHPGTNSTFQDILEFYLSNIVIPYTVLLCNDVTGSSHTSHLDRFYRNISDVCVFVTHDAISCRKSSMLRDKHKDSAHTFVDQYGFVYSSVACGPNCLSELLMCIKTSVIELLSI